MKTRIVLFLFTLLLKTTSQTFAQGFAFTYQGQLSHNGTSYSGIAEFRPTLWDAANGGTQLAANTPAQIELGVTNGLFILPLDFGSNFPGAARWLQLEIRTNSAAFTTLAPRQQITPAPYAITAASISGPLVSANLAGAFSSAVTFDNSANSFVGNGAGLTALNADQLTSGFVPEARLSPNIARADTVWQLGGNAGTTPATHFLGTTDPQPLEIKVNGMRGLRLEPVPVDIYHSNIVNVIAGSSVNFAAPGVSGATIAGGGALNYVGESYINSVEADFGTVSGGLRNAIKPGAVYSSIAGGSTGIIDKDTAGAFIGGGLLSDIGTNSSFSSIVGGSYNSIGNNTKNAKIGGGQANGIGVNSEGALIDGGNLNYIGNNAQFSTIGGGFANAILNDSTYGTVPGGRQNYAGPFAFAAGTRARAYHNGAFVWSDSQTEDTFESTANNQFLIRARGGLGINKNNPATALDVNGVVTALGFNIPDGAGFGIGTLTPQGSLHVYSANNPTVVRVQSTGAPGFGRVEFVSNAQGDPNEWRPGYIQSTDSGGFTGGLSFVVNGTGAANKFAELETMRIVNGRVGIGTATPVSALQVVGTITATAINPSSDRNLKENFTPVTPRDILEKVIALPVSQWNFKGATDATHLGPMAQDFHTAFNLGSDDKHIATVDADGVALAAIQGLNEKLEQKINEIAELKQSVNELKDLVARLNQKLEGRLP